MTHEPVRIGNVEVLTVCEGYAPVDLAEELPGVGVDWEAERRRYPWAFHDEGSWAWHVHAFALRTPNGVVMVDCGVGGFPPYRPWAVHTEADVALAGAGVDPGDVRVVIHTHLHADHAGGSILDGGPRFPNAVHHVHRADWSFFGQAERIDGYTARRPMEELERLGMVQLGDGDREVVSGVRMVHAPGHTPGHRVVTVTSGDETLLLTGDLLHVPIQVERPEVHSSHDVDPEAGCRSRLHLLERARHGRWRIAVSHFGQPVGRVESSCWISGV